MPTAIDVFAGCGGLTAGLKKAGFHVMGAIEIDTLAKETYEANHPDVKFISKDIREVAAASLMRKVGIRKGELDLLAGCPPCQGFSTLRTNNSGKAVRDPRNDLIMEFLRLVERMRPKAVMLENVPGLAKDRRFNRFAKRLGELGYKGNYDVLDTADYGVPQRRRRLIFLASLVGAPPLATPSIHGSRTVRDAIGHLPIPGTGSDKLHNLPERRSEKVKKLIKMIPLDGGSRSDLPEEVRLDCHSRCDGFYDVYGRMCWDDVSPTITSGCFNPSKGRFLHPEQHRAITMREAALLQGFPRGYRFPTLDNKSAIALMIGNALPPPFVAAHAKSVLKTIRSSSVQSKKTGKPAFE